MATSSRPSASARPTSAKPRGGAALGEPALGHRETSRAAQVEEHACPLAVGDDQRAGGDGDVGEPGVEEQAPQGPPHQPGAKPAAGGGGHHRGGVGVRGVDDQGAPVGLRRHHRPAGAHHARHLGHRSGRALDVLEHPLGAAAVHRVVGQVDRLGVRAE